eukprot:8837428-Alexandrium_andersonii.AAC.1
MYGLESLVGENATRAGLVTVRGQHMRLTLGMDTTYEHGRLERRSVPKSEYAVPWGAEERS